MAKRERIVVIFPGRGSYAAKELGYLSRHHGDRLEMVRRLDAMRVEAGATPTLELDGQDRFSPSQHLPGRNASNLIYTAALSDFAAIDRERYEVVAVCGNSLGWYLSLAGAGALSLEDGAHLVDTMGALMEAEAVGGQLLYPVSHDDWTVDAEARAATLATVADTANAFLSIDLAGTLVLAGDKAAVTHLQSALPPVDGNPPIQLPKHGAFHTPLLEDVTKMAQDALPAAMFAVPKVPMVDGRGVIWSPDSTDVEALYDYTLFTQIVETYDFARSVEVACKEFAPDRLMLMGPGSSLGAPIAQTLIRHRWNGLTSREDFMSAQADDPFLIALGRGEQRSLGVGD
ncbi:ACP S-malonyltransferase [Aurantiacibacter gangjinensis]|uniref:[acyl-carrier-protein] S-malonyltransferase n=1 Tax=Aurantiacibacter gangjinensis TaxID=502682 RepID=A0A0G9MMA1_9SPHN|nr:ACP S-malonyltransferase [Aurantiacibacter gangjinensis]APE27899.1 Acyl-carrier domain protein [Aurantiacibacter gangjinensis]KLE31861.1 hypothetical protein AAW01_10320 [Aurantiacibacter gangjinensis]